MDESERRFQQVQAGHARATRASGPWRESHYGICDQRVRMRITGARLAAQIEPAFEHLRAADPAEPTLTIDLWDARETGTAGSAPPDCHAEGRSWGVIDGVFAVSADGHIVSHQLRRSVVWLDRRAGRMAGWFDDGSDLSLLDRGRPLHTLLALWASDLGVKAVHAAFVAQDGLGVLVPGASGSGKSTVALACLEAGHVYLGDDWIGIRHLADGAFVGHGLYSSAFLGAAHARWFPELARHALPPRGAEDKALLLLSSLVPERLGASAAIRALALPRIVGRGRTEVRRASKAEALLRLAPSAIFELSPRAGREEVERLAELAEAVPAYWLDIGADLSEVPQRVVEILRRGVSM